MSNVVSPSVNDSGSAAASSPLLSAVGIELAFGGTQAIAGATLHVHADELVAVIGPNGAGKTSLFNVLTGVYTPQHGDVTLDGVRLLGKKPREIAELGVSRTFQNLGLFPAMTALDNVITGCHLRMTTGVVRALLGLNRREEQAFRREAEEYLWLCGVGELAHHAVGRLPYGQQKLVELARALAMRPRLLMLDEPVAGLNYEEKREFVQIIEMVRAQLRLSVLLVEHDMQTVMRLADRVMVLDFGRTIAVGTPEEVQGDPQVRRAYLGDEVTDAPAPSGQA
jgi:branched-chain amino acid transport system ATP-binding protein